MAWLEVLHGGLMTTVQDAGRPGFARMGFAPAGAMDTEMLAAANVLVGNPPGAAALEVTLDGPVFTVHGEAILALAAVDGEWFVSGPEQPLPLWETVLARDGSLIAVGAVRAGARAYLAVAGGVDVPPVMGSRSTHVRARIGGLDGRPLSAGDRVPIGPSPRPCEELLGRRVPPELRPARRAGPIRVMLGPQDDAFTPRGLRTFLHSAFRVTARGDRMGVRLMGPPIEARRGYDIVSDATAPGSIQVSGDGQPIVLLAERPTTGGYPKIATVIGADLDAMGQVRPGQHVRFLSVDEAAARRAREERRRRLAEIEWALARQRPERGGAFVVSTDAAVYYVHREAG
ncbi:biotin-dependent carboxyltransferase family protein [Carboxydochorda subterranea]|uniref:Biotin-dependent carboxyltransferase family protein n=1 Tax=Carboxydichorda subterranea TaxID=3109565 RepID=A0ABZ1BZN0_9FIRM|nr:biotin-dependent carboxyltransferase family protein [Limnochorda sp. L945t]WRP18020.1 biotin-dependent carboxyltransferase family protein [Limnochorda sp. L945t]